MINLLRSLRRRFVRLFKRRQHIPYDMPVHAMCRCIVLPADIINDPEPSTYSASVEARRHWLRKLFGEPPE